MPVLVQVNGKPDRPWNVCLMLLYRISRISAAEAFLMSVRGPFRPLP
jgi:hypothetical protein